MKLRFTKSRTVSWPDEKLLAYQEEPYCMDITLVSADLSQENTVTHEGHSRRIRFDIWAYHHLTGWIKGLIMVIKSANLAVNVSLIVPMNIGSIFQIQLCLTVHHKFCNYNLLSAIFLFVHLIHVTCEID